MVEDDKAARLYSLLMVIRNINQALLRAKSEPDLFQHICDSLSDIYKFAWIGLMEKGSTEIRPVAQGGVEEGYLSSIKVTWDDSDYGRGPIGSAIKTGLPFIIRDIEADPRYKLWREEATRRGYASSIALPLMYEGETIGALNVYSERNDAFGDEEKEFLVDAAADITVGVKSLRRAKELEQRCKDLQKGLSKTVEAISLMSEIQDPYTADHQHRVARLAAAIAKEMGLSADQIEGIRVAGILHDIGKAAIPVEILNKRGEMSQYELGIIKTHPLVGHEILKEIGFPWPVAQIVLQHHERLDGSGYPSGLLSGDISLEARILAVADVVEAMASHRPYRPALGVERAIHEISQKKGVLYDPQAVDACKNILQRGWFEFR